jgi:hypothetical protein
MLAGIGGRAAPGAGRAAGGRDRSAPATDYARQRLRLDPLDEAAYRRLMHLLAAVGDRAGALRVYHACVGALERELAVEPDPATREVYERLLGADTGTPPPPAAPVSPGATGAAVVGRGPERERLRAAWRRADGGAPMSSSWPAKPGSASPAWPRSSWRGPASEAPRRRAPAPTRRKAD